MALENSELESLAKEFDLTTAEGRLMFYYFAWVCATIQATKIMKKYITDPHLLAQANEEMKKLAGDPKVPPTHLRGHIKELMALSMLMRLMEAEKKELNV